VKRFRPGTLALREIRKYKRSGSRPRSRSRSRSPFGRYPGDVISPGLYSLSPSTVTPLHPSGSPRGLEILNENPVYGGKRRVLVPQIDSQGRIIPGKFKKYSQEDFLLRYHGPHPKHPRLPNFFKEDAKGVNEKGNIIILRYKKPIFLNSAQEEVLFGKAKRREDKKANRRLIEKIEQEDRNMADERQQRRRRAPKEGGWNDEEEEEESGPPQKKPLQAVKTYFAQKQQAEEEEEEEEEADPYFEDAEWGGARSRSSSQQRKQRQREEEDNLQLAIQEARSGGRSRSKSKSPSRGAGGGAPRRQRKSRSSLPSRGASARRKRSRSRSRSNEGKSRGKGGAGKRARTTAGDSEGRIVQKRVATRGKCYRDMFCVFDDGEEIKHTYNNHDWIGKYIKSKNVIHRLRDYDNPTQFALAHIHETNPGRPAVNGWSKCLVKRGSEWVKIKRLRCRHCLDREEDDNLI